jgi:acetyl-CoA/propionyl-CoA carboxylase carboxyl transferase subunit
MSFDGLLNELERWRATVEQGGGADRIEAQHAKGKLTARERLSEFLDAGTFYETDPFVTHRHSDFGLDQQRHPGDSVVTGLGYVEGRRVAVFAQDFTVLGGTFSEAQALKVCRLMDAALASGVPIVALDDSGGARIQEGVWSLAGYADLFWHHTQASGVIPQISVMLGSCAGGSVLSPGLTDFVIMTTGTSHMFITGPKVIKTVTGEQVTFDQLGGAGVHSNVSGVAHFQAANEREALQITRRLLSYLPSNNLEQPPYIAPADAPNRRDPALDEIIPTDPAKAYDMQQVIACVFDTGTFLEVHAQWACNCIVGLARLNGNVVGVVAQQPTHLGGLIDVNASDKMARFIRFCDAFNIPLVTFVDSPGFLPGTGQEHGGIIRHGAKIVYAYSEATVPKISIVTRKAYGGAYIVMASKLTRTDLALAWPTAEIAVMGAEGAVNILYGKKLKDMPETEAQAERERLVDEYRQKFADPYPAATAGQIDDVIAPSETRPRLIAALRFLCDKQASLPPKKHGNIPL